MNFELLQSIMSKAISNGGMGHWKLVPGGALINPLEKHGFIYLVHNTKDDKYYIGKKITTSGGKAYLIKNGKKISNPRKGRETDWKTYTGSSKALNADIKRHSREYFQFYILCFINTPGGLTYTEANWQHKLDVMVSDRWYNENIAAIKFKPKEWGVLDGQ